MTRDPWTRFAASITFEMNGCWEWRKPVRSNNGYPRFYYDGRQRNAHRAAYELLVGAIPEGHEIDHLCRNVMCVNPLHLEAVTPAENILRANGWGGRNARKTHCVHGHEFTPENTYIRANGLGRLCRACDRARLNGWERQRARAA